MPIDAYHVVLTACIAPRTVSPLVARVDPNVRLDDYIRSLRFWLSFDDPRCVGVVLLENSGHPLDALQEVAARENRHGRLVDIRHAGDNHIPEGISYGYAELGMLDAAADTLPSWSAAPLIAKVTGRLTFPDLPRLIGRLDAGDRFVGDARSQILRPSRRTSENGIMSTQLLLFTPQFYREHFYGIRSLMRPEDHHMLIESVLYRALWPLRHDPGVRMRFPVNCAPFGQAAHWQKDYRNFRERRMSFFRAGARIVAPWFWC